ncbi:hypothetical protein ALC62_01318, partial [Cyphomyrmex costatus]
TMGRRTKGIGKNTILARSPNVIEDLSRPRLSRHCQGHYPTKGYTQRWQWPPKVGCAGKIKGSNLDLSRRIIVSVRHC